MSRDRRPAHPPRRRLGAGERGAARCARAPARRPPRSRCERRAQARPATARSEEHTSELQSLMRISYAVFCLQKKISFTIFLLLFFYNFYSHFFLFLFFFFF